MWSKTWSKIWYDDKDDKKIRKYKSLLTVKKYIL